jgi:amidophosphoribosyltransferase
LIDAVCHKHSKITRFDCSVFTGEYVTQDISADYLSQLELFRSDAAKEARRVRAGNVVIELHNAS